MPDRFQDLNISVFSLLPLALQSTDTEGKLQAMCDVLESEVLTWDDLADQVRDSARADVAPLAFMNMMWAEYGIDAPNFADITRQRRALFSLPSLLARKGNPLTVRNVIILLTGLSCEVVHQWNDSRWFRAGITKSGIHQAGVSYQGAIPNSGPHRSGFTAGYAQAGISPIGSGPINERQRLTIQLKFPRPITYNEERAVSWAIQYFSRAVDIYEIQIKVFTKYWIVGQSRVGSGTKVKPCCWQAGISKAGISTVCCSGPPASPPTTPITPGSPGTWVPWHGGQSVFFPSPAFP